MITLNVEYLPDEKIAEATEKFRQEYGLIEIPIQIEELVEFKLEMDIVPTPGLRTLIQTDGFISSDFTAIYVDEEISNCRTPYKLRFTLAHEVGHFALHREYISQVSYTNFDEYVAACTAIDDRDHNKMEYQGYTFGGLLLVPPPVLTAELRVLDAEKVE